MRVLFVIDHLGGGGAEQQFVQIANGVSAEKTVYLTEGGGTRAGDLHGDIPVAGGRGRRTPLRSALELRRLIEDRKPDIVHAFLMYSCFVTALSLTMARRHPVFIAQEFSSPAEILDEVRLPALKKALLKFAYRKARKVVTVSRAVRDDLVKKGFVADAGKAAFVHDGLDLRKYGGLQTREALRKKLGLSAGGCYLCFVGSLVERKGLRYLLEAFREVQEPGARLLVVGDGPGGQVFREMAAADRRVEFLGYRKNGAEYIKASDVLVLPSYYEGLPNVVMEAMVVGTPVIATEVFGTPELIEDNATGLLVPPRDKDSLREAMGRMIADPPLRSRLSGEAAKKAGYYSVGRMIGEYEEIYRRLLGAPEGS
jgi:glycosyltransferase involved in cell wall biosynthesis